MSISRAEAKRQARESMRGRKPSVYVMAFVFLAFNNILSTLALRLQFPGLRSDDLMQTAIRTEAELERFYTLFLRRMLDAMQNRTWVNWVLTILIGVFAIALSVGFTSYCLAVARRQKAGFFQLFDVFGNLFRVLWLSILRALLVTLWSLPAVAGYTLMIFSLLELPWFNPALALLGLPLAGAGIALGVMASYRYSLAVYLLLDAPDKGALACIRESKALTRGRKWELFVLDLSLLGWRLLSQLPFVSIYTRPYMETTWANYYRAISGAYDAPEHIDYTV